MAPVLKLSLSLLSLSQAVAGVSLSVASSGGNATSPYHYGLMFEDINHSGDGGIYAELLRNRAFQGDETFPVHLDPWTAVGDASLALSNDTTPLSSVLPTSLSVTANSDGVVGFKNPGWWGINVDGGKTYSGSFYQAGDFSSKFTAKLVSENTGKTLATTRVRSKSKSQGWTQFTYQLQPSEDAPDSENSLVIEYEATAGQTFNFNLISLFPPTFNDRKNGLRKDLVEDLVDLNPGYFRIPGGNNLEGDSPPRYWNWTQTLGPLKDRRGYPGVWSYENTQGLGLVEYLDWSEDMGAETVLGLWAGLWLDGSVISEDELQPYIDDALAEIEFVNGDADTTHWGGVRAKLRGHKKPYNVKFVEVGNEDNLSNGLESYKNYRFEMFYKAIKEKYPDLLIFSSTTEKTFQQSGQDYHEYTRPDHLVSQFGFFDNWEAKNPIMVGEYAAVQNNSATKEGVDWDEPRGPWPYWIGSVAEAVFLLGTERNSDKIFGVSYAPLLQNLNNYQWTPDLIGFTADYSETVLSTSYHLIKLLAANLMSNTLPATTDDSASSFGPAYWVAGADDSGSRILKAVVYNSTEPVPFSVKFDGVAAGTSAQLTVLTSPDGAFGHNTIEESDAVAWETTEVAANDAGKFEFELPDLSVAVLKTESKKA